jgi:hypothetical protein
MQRSVPAQPEHVNRPRALRRATRSFILVGTLNDDRSYEPGPGNPISFR